MCNAINNFEWRILFRRYFCLRCRTLYKDTCQSDLNDRFLKAFIYTNRVSGPSTMDAFSAYWISVEQESTAKLSIRIRPYEAGLGWLGFFGFVSGVTRPNSNSEHDAATVGGSSGPIFCFDCPFFCIAMSMSRQKFNLTFYSNCNLQIAISLLCKLNSFLQWRARAALICLLNVFYKSFYFWPKLRTSMTYASFLVSYNTTEI